MGLSRVYSNDTFGPSASAASELGTPLATRSRRDATHVASSAMARRRSGKSSSTGATASLVLCFSQYSR